MKEELNTEVERFQRPDTPGMMLYMKTLDPIHHPPVSAKAINKDRPRQDPVSQQNKVRDIYPLQPRAWRQITDSPRIGP